MTIDLPAAPKKILIVKPSALGDVVHTLPILHLLRRRWPGAHIAWLVVPAFASLLQQHPDLDEILYFERKELGSFWRHPSKAKSLFSFAMHLRRQKYDLVIDLQGLLRSAWITWQTRAATRVGFSYAREGAPMFYTHRVPTSSTERHAVDRYLDVAEALGCGRGPVVFDFAIPGEARQKIADLTRDIGNYCVLLPGTNWDTKRWPVEKFADLVEPIAERFKMSCVVAGGNDVVPLAPRIQGAHNLAGKTNLKELAALIEKAELVIANDSGPMHIAAAMKRPLVTIFGPTNPIRTGPYERLNTVVQLDLPCRPCYSRSCSHTSCMNWLTTEHVLAQAERWMSDNC